MKLLSTLRKLIIGCMGFTVLGIGILLLILPGPGLLILALGIAILATEFAWAQWLQRKLKKGAAQLSTRLARKY